MTADLLKDWKPSKISFLSSMLCISDFHLRDSEEIELFTRFEIRLFKAKTNIDVVWAKLAYSAAQCDRLGRKLSMMNLKVNN